MRDLPRFVLVLPVLGFAVATVPDARAADNERWLRCTLTTDVVRDTSGKETKKDLPGGSSVVFIINDANQAFFTYDESKDSMTKLQADVRPRQVTFFDGPLSDTINRMTGTFTVVQSPYHEADGTCAPIDPLSKGKPKF